LIRATQLLLVCLALACNGAAVAGSTTRLSAAAELGRKLFFDAALSASGKLSCASCHDPANAYGAPNAAPVVMRGGARLDRPGLRAVPSLRYLAQTPRFTRHGYRDTGTEREDVGPAGGFMLDGRADNLHEQSLLPLLDPAEMANASFAELARRLHSSSYAPELLRIASASRTDSRAWVEAAAHALERFELEDPSFHPYNSRFDQYLRGSQALSAQELAGLQVFMDPAKGNCAACHTATTGPQGRAPDFTDYSYHALGVPRNPAIPANRDANFFDLGLCGPLRTDLRGERQYCGYFKTPTLRNVARRRHFFHNGRFDTLADVLHFYAERTANPSRWYPRDAAGLHEFDDLPARYRANVDISDPPLDRKRGAAPALDATAIAALLAFLRTLNDAD
jgi:cytochrome c peroxidase